METTDTFRPKYQAFLESNMSAKAFCRQIGMNESHFYCKPPVTPVLNKSNF